jgi:hypothetical protein
MTDEKQSSVWVGPTSFDNERMNRQEDIDGVWDIVKPLLQGEHFRISTYSIVGVALDLLREALNCYQNGAYLATCSMCRVCSECFLYLSTTRKPKSKKDVLEIRENFVREKRRVSLNSALEDGIITKEESISIQRIWDTGDFAMHIHQKIDLNHRRWAMLVSAGHFPEDYVSKGWSDRAEALATMTETASVMSKIMIRLNRIN